MCTKKEETDNGEIDYRFPFDFYEDERMNIILTILFLLVGGIAAGLFATVASIASLASYPVLLAVGIPPVYANVTNDAALIWTGISSTISATKELKGHWKEVFFYSIFTIIGSIGGCILLLIYPPKVFEKLVPWFVLFSGIMVIVSGRYKIEPTNDKTPKWLMIIYIIAMLIMGAYTGYFGAAGGVLILVLLSYLSKARNNFAVIKAEENVVSGFANLVALIIFAFASKIYWLQSIPLAIGMFIGGYLGPKIVRKVPEKPIRIFIAILAFVQAAYFFWEAYL